MNQLWLSLELILTSLLHVLPTAALLLHVCAAYVQVGGDQVVLLANPDTALLALINSM